MRILDNMGLVQDPFHLGVVILDKLIGDLKAKVPFLSKKKGNDEEGDEDSDEDTSTETEVPDVDDSDNTNVSKSSDEDDEESTKDNSLIGKIKAQLTAFRKKKDVGLDEDSDSPDTAKEKKKPNLIVIVGALLLIGFIFLSDFGDDTTPVADPAKMLKPREKKKPKPPEEKPVETPVTENPTVTTPETPTETPTVTTPTDTVPTETTPETPAETPTVTTPTDTVPTETPTTETPTTESPITTTPTDGLPVETTPPDATVTTPIETTPTETVPTDTTMTSPTSTDSVNGEDTPKSEDNLTDQILKDLEDQAKDTEKKPMKTEYVPPPNYENVGRGLVYNCTGKHWACVDAPSYRNCEDNSSSNKFAKKKAECYPFNVYEAQSGCEKMQNRMVSSGSKTEFCAD